MAYCLGIKDTIAILHGKTVYNAADLNCLLNLCHSLHMRDSTYDKNRFQHLGIKNEWIIRMHSTNKYICVLEI